jgi:hypothetical protein
MSISVGVMHWAVSPPQLQYLCGVEEVPVEHGADQRRVGRADELHARFAAGAGRIVDHGSNQGHQELAELGVEPAVFLAQCRPGVIVGHPGLFLHVGVGIGALQGLALAAIVALLARAGPIGDRALAVGDRLADDRTRRIALGPQAANQRLRGLAGRDVHLVHLLHLLRQLIHDLADFGRDRVDRELESEAERVVGGGFEHRHEFGGVDERERAREEVDAAAAGARVGQLQVEGLDVLLGKARPDRSHRIVARRLALVGAGAGDIGLDAHVGHEALHLAFDPGRRGSGRGEQDCGAEHRAKRTAGDLAETGGRRAGAHQ